MSAVPSSVTFTAPGTSIALNAAGEWLESPDQEKFPIVCGVPLIFPRDGLSTFPAYLASLRITDPTDCWQIETLAIDKEQQEEVRQAISAGQDGDVDPVVKHLILATNGIAYSHLVGKLHEYPIPDFPLPSSDGAQLLDLGCSWGRWCVSAARQGYRVTGIDPSLGALLAAQRVAKSLGADSRYVCGDARCLPFAEGSFDVVHSYSVLQHLSDEDARAAWRETARVLRPGGAAVIQMANMWGLRSLYHIARRRFQKAKRFEVRYRTPPRLLQLANETLASAGLEVDCYFGLGLQDSDRRFYSWPARTAIGASNALKATSRLIPPLKLWADSLYVRANKPVG